MQVWYLIFVLFFDNLLGCHALLLTPDHLAQFGSAEKLGDVGSHSITEASGLAASRTHPNVLYTQNDNGDKARIFAIRIPDGHKMAEYDIHGAENWDWEDLAMGPCPGGGNCIYISDTGDHGGDGARNIIYRVREPTSITDQTLPVDGVLRFTWNEPDAETLMVDPSGEVYIISKVDGGKGKVAHVPGNWNSNAVTSITRVTSIGIPTTSHPDPVGGDISPNGKEVLVKTRNSIFYWYVPDGSYIDVLATHPISLPYTHEHRGEAVCWDGQGSGYYTLGEGNNEHIYYYRRVITG